ncbi:annexin D5 [Olea europaea subsp. europaea]|uniref:Annexin D5 n=1 Tax=Olea europaea subsp. europaea TaxID=158383 RepID=A0A8S0VCJ0_OLEEU|nr:annexin D5 [Olea europaea subsp. europaea]
MYSEELRKCLALELGGDVKRVVLLWMPDPTLRNATIVRNALSGDKIDLKAATEAVKSETSRRFKFALLTILRCAENLGKYFAKVLHKAMKGMGTDDTTLTRVIVTRADIDMQYIKVESRVLLPRGGDGVGVDGVVIGGRYGGKEDGNCVYVV